MILFYYILELFRQCDIFLFNISFIYTMILDQKVTFQYQDMKIVEK